MNREVRLWVGERAAKETKRSDLELGKEEQKCFLGEVNEDIVRTQGNLVSLSVTIYWMRALCGLSFMMRLRRPGRSDS